MKHNVEYAKICNQKYNMKHMHYMHLLIAKGSPKKRANLVPTSVAYGYHAIVLSLFFPIFKNIPPAIMVQPHCPRRVALIALIRSLALFCVIDWHKSNWNPMISPHVFVDIQKAFCYKMKTITLSW